MMTSEHRDFEETAAYTAWARERTRRRGLDLGSVSALVFPSDAGGDDLMTAVFNAAWFHDLAATQRRTR